jgi:phthiocerol/phenolphthiocerol synthesis type-I polyketide synthase D
MGANTGGVPSARRDPVAVIGIGCRFPGGEGRPNAGNPDQFWDLLLNGVDAITQVPPDRWDDDALYHPDPARGSRLSVRHGGFVEDIDQFDAGFFGIPPVEADRVDPQHRMLLEET